MPPRQIPDTDVEYYLLAFDKNGVEQPGADGTLGSDAVRAILADPSNGITDVFLTSHGWKGDVPAAIEQYDRWIGAMAAAAGDRALARQVRPGFKALAIGFHWPSLPWGDESLPEEGVLGDAPTAAKQAVADTTTGTAGLEQNIERFADRIADTPDARSALRTILSTADRAIVETPALPPDVRAAYETLYAESGLRTGDVAAAPGADHEQWDPDALYQEALVTGDANDPEAGLLGERLDRVHEALLGPLRQASFWRMKDRAWEVGEQGGHTLLRALQTAAQPGVRFHLMGHSFGCIVVSASIAGPKGAAPLPRPIDSLFLVQGALSLWSYCNDIPYEPGTAGYFTRIMADGLVRGPIVTTRSTFDKAVGGLYPKAAGLKRQLVLDDDEFPKYGGVGSFGLQGLGKRATDLTMHDDTTPYGFAPGRVYNIEASGVIKDGGGMSGAHSDIAHPEVAHVMWEAALAG